MGVDDGSSRKRRKRRRSQREEEEDDDNLDDEDLDLVMENTGEGSRSTQVWKTLYSTLAFCWFKGLMVSVIE